MRLTYRRSVVDARCLWGRAARLLPLLAVAGSAALADQARAAPIYGGGAVRQAIAMAGPAGGGSVGDSVSSLALGLWNDTAAASYVNASPPFGDAQASATQSSAIDSSGVGMFNTFVLESSAPYMAIGESFLAVSFLLLEPTPYESSTVGTPLLFSFTNGGQAFGANSSGILPAANYSLQIRFRSIVGAELNGGNLTANFEYHLRLIPEPSTWLLGLLGGTAVGLAYSRGFTRALPPRRKSL